MKSIIKKALLVTAAATLISVTAAPKNVMAMSGPANSSCSFCGATKNCLCSVLESQYHCGNTKYEHGVVYTLGCRGDGETCKPEWMKSSMPAQIHSKVIYQPADSKHVAETINTIYSYFYEYHPVDKNILSQVHALNPGLSLDTLTPGSDISVEEFNAMITSYFNTYDEHIAFYESEFNTNNAQLAPYAALLNDNVQ